LSTRDVEAIAAGRAMQTLPLGSLYPIGAAGFAPCKRGTHAQASFALVSVAGRILTATRAIPATHQTATRACTCALGHCRERQSSHHWTP